tara:strand:- start:4037 stop:4546 length:510 start_codon:yes stop_codon:yes gene_type:complete
MALFGTQRDVSLIKKINRELLGDIITQQCAVYKLNISETKVNIYGEASGEKYYQDPVLFNVLIERGDQTYSTGDMGVDYGREMEFRFFRDDLVDASVVMEPGDIIMYYEAYFEVDSVVDNQLFVGKDPRYPYNENPLNPGLENFGANESIICKTHHVPADKVQITRERL